MNIYKFFLIGIKNHFSKIEQVGWCKGCPTAQGCCPSSSGCSQKCFILGKCQESHWKPQSNAGQYQTTELQGTV